MPNYCRNEVHIYVPSLYGAGATLEKIRDLMRETVERFEERVEIARIEDQRYKAPFRSIGDIVRRQLDFNNFFPYPEEFKQKDRDCATMSQEDYKAKYGEEVLNQHGHVKDGYNSGGYEWCIKHWGSKWNAFSAVWVEEHKTMYFDTAWSPVFRIVSELHKRFPETYINYEYYEKGTAFMGGCEFIPEAEWDASDYPKDKVFEIEKISKLTGTAPEYAWAAGTPYNSWTSEYPGYKGG